MNVQHLWNNFCTKLKHIFGIKILLIAIFFEENWICSIHRILWQVTLMSRTPHSHAHTRTRRTAHVCAHTLFHYSLPCRNSPTGPTIHTYTLHWSIRETVANMAATLCSAFSLGHFFLLLFFWLAFIPRQIGIISSYMSPAFSSISEFFFCRE